MRNKFSKRLSLILTMFLAIGLNTPPTYGSANCDRSPKNYTNMTINVEDSYTFNVYKGIPIYGDMTNLSDSTNDYHISTIGDAEVFADGGPSSDFRTYYWGYTPPNLGSNSLHLQYTGVHRQREKTGTNNSGGSNYDTYSHVDDVDEYYTFNAIDYSYILSLTPQTLNYSERSMALYTENYNPSITLVTPSGNISLGSEYAPYYTISCGRCEFHTNSSFYLSGRSNKISYMITSLVNPIGQTISATTSNIDMPGKYTVNIKASAPGINFTGQTYFTLSGTITGSKYTESDSYAPIGINTSDLSKLPFTSTPQIKVNDSTYIDSIWANRQVLKSSNDYCGIVQDMITIPSSLSSCANYASAGPYYGDKKYFYINDLTYNMTAITKEIAPTEAIPAATSYITGFKYSGWYKKSSAGSKYTVTNVDLAPQATYIITSCKDSFGQAVSYDNIRNKAGLYSITIKGTNGLFSSTVNTTIKVKNTLSSISYDNSAIVVDWKTNLETVKGKLPTSVTLVNDDSTTVTGTVSNWTCSNYNAQRAGTYTFTGTVALPSTVNNFKNVSLTISKTVSVKNPKVASFSTNTSTTTINVPYNTPLSTALNSVNHTVQVKGEDGSVTNVALNKSSWTGVYTQTVPGIYALKQNFNLPSNLTANSAVVLTVTQNLQVLKPNVISVIPANKSDITKELKTTAEDINEALATTCTLNCNGNYTEQQTLSSWSCSTYNPNVPGEYIFSSTAILPATMTNTENVSLTVKRKVILTRPKVVSIKFTGTGSSLDSSTTYVEYGTEKSEALASVQASLVVTLSDGETINISPDTSTATFSPNYDKHVPSNYTAKIDISSSLPAVVDLGDEGKCEVNYIITVQKPEAIGYELYDSNNILIGSKANRTMHVDYGTSESQVKAKLPAYMKVLVNDGSTIKEDLSSTWNCSNYESCIVSDYTFTHPVDFTTFKNSDYFEFEFTVSVNRGIMKSFECYNSNDEKIGTSNISSQHISVTYNSSVEYVNACLPSYLKIKLNNGNIVTQNITGSWTSDNYEKTEVGEYVFTHAIDTTLYDNPEDLALAYTVSVLEPVITSAEYIDRNNNSMGFGETGIIEVDYGTSKEVAMTSLPPFIRFNVDNGGVIIKPISGVWSCDDYDSHVPGMYTFNHPVEFTGFQNLNEISLNYYVKVKNPVVIDYELYDENDVLIANSNILTHTINVPYNTSRAEVLSKFPKVIKFTVNDGTVITRDIVGSWVNTDYNPIRVGTYIFSHDNNFSGIDGLSTVDIGYTVNVNKTIFNDIVYDNSTLAVDPIYSIDQLRSMMPTDVIVTGTGGYSQRFILDKENWDLTNVKPKVKGVYTTSYEFTLPDSISCDTRSYTLMKQINVGNPTISNVKFATTTASAITVEYGTSFESVKNLAVKSVSIDLDNGESKIIPINKDNWTCSNYCGTQPGIYLISNDLQLPQNILNKNNIRLTVSQVVNVKNYTLLGIQYDSIPILSYPYDTDVDTIKGDLVDSVKVMLNNGDLVFSDVDYNTWNTSYTLGSVPGNYSFNNVAQVITNDQGDFTNSTTVSALGFTLTTSSSLRIAFSQQVGISNRRITDIKATDGSYPIKGKKYSQSDLTTLIADLPRHYKYTFDNGKTLDIEADEAWTQVNYDKIQHIYTYSLNLPLPEYTIGDTVQTIEISTKIPSSSYPVVNTYVPSVPTVEPKVEPIVKPEQKTYNNIAFIVQSPDWYKNGEVQDTKLDVPPEIVTGRLYIPVRYISYALNISDENVLWNPTAKQVSLKMDDNSEVILTIGSKNVLVNGEVVTIDGEPYIQNGRTMLPISQITKLLLKDDTYSIKWIPETLEVKLVFDDDSKSDDTDFIEYQDDIQAISREDIK